MAAAKLDTRIARVVDAVGPQFRGYAERTMATWDAGQQVYVGIPSEDSIVRDVLLARVRGEERPPDGNGWDAIKQRIWDELEAQGL